MGYGLKELAAELNLSMSTVSRVVNNTGRVSPETRERVLKLVNERNYTPNRIALSLQRKKSKTVGLIVPDLGDYFASVIKGAEGALSLKGYSMFLADSREDEQKEAHYIKLMMQSQVDGIMLATVSNNFDWINEYKNTDIQAVFFDNEPPEDICCHKVIVNNIKSTEIAVNHLISCGYKSIALICGNTEESTARYRKEGFVEAMKKAKLSVDEALIRECRYYIDAGYAAMQELIRNRDEHPFEAVIASTYRLSCSALRAIKEYDLKYPDDIAFVGFDIEDRDKLFSPSITSIIQPGEKIGQTLAQKLIKLIEKGDIDTPKSCSVVNPMIKVGESTGKKNAK